MAGERNLFYRVKRKDIGEGNTLSYEYCYTRDINNDENGLVLRYCLLPKYVISFFLTCNVKECLKATAKLRRKEIVLIPKGINKEVTKMKDFI